MSDNYCSKEMMSNDNMVDVNNLDLSGNFTEEYGMPDIRNLKKDSFTFRAHEDFLVLSGLVKGKAQNNLKKEVLALSNREMLAVWMGLVWMVLVCIVVEYWCRLVCPMPMVKRRFK